MQNKRGRGRGERAPRLYRHPPHTDTVSSATVCEGSTSGKRRWESRYNITGSFQEEGRGKGYKRGGPNKMKGTTHLLSSEK